MKNLIITAIIYVFVLMLWVTLGMKKWDRNIFLSPTTLDKASPLNVNIDVDFIKGLNPAYDR